MKKILILLIVLGFAMVARPQGGKDTLFFLESSKINTKILITIADSVYNSNASLRQNYYALKGAEVHLADTNHYIYSGLYRSRILEESFLKFDEEKGKNIVLQKPLSYPFEFAYEFILIFLISFALMFFLQGMVTREKFYDIKNLWLLSIIGYNFIILMISVFLTESYFGKVVSSLLMAIILAILIIVVIANTRLFFKNVLVRDSIIILFLVFFVLILVMQDFMVISVTVSILGVVFGIPSIYFWKWQKKRKDLSLMKSA